jgi:hypothetical protein
MRLNTSIGRSPLGGILRAERNFSLSCDFSSETNSGFPLAKFFRAKRLFPLSASIFQGKKGKKKGKNDDI